MRIALPGGFLLLFMAVQAFDVTIPGQGSVRGTEDERYSSVAYFGDIPFAKPPVGNLRWKSPQPADPWEGVRDATIRGDVCPMREPSRFLKENMSEDCLNLNVFVPKDILGTGKKLPVMVWFHGGGYSSGSGHYPLGALVEQSRGQVVVVSGNYRLHALGFLGSSELAKANNDGSTGNYGIEDQVMVMKWVKSYIEAFGGDKDSVTIFGESAGGNSVINHLVNPQTEGLYHRAIIMSGAYDRGAHSLGKATTIYDKVKRNTDCADVDCLLKVDPFEILEASKVEDDEQVLVQWAPCVDGVFLKTYPMDLIEKGEQHNKVPTMVGSVRDEFAMFLLALEEADLLCSWIPFVPRITYNEFLDAYATGWDKSTKDDIDRLYTPGQGYPYPSDTGSKCVQYWWQTTRIATDTVPGLGLCGTRWLARSLAEQVPVHVYQFNQPTSCNSRVDAEYCEFLEESIPGTAVDEKGFLVPHASEVLYSMGETFWMLEPDQVKLAQEMSTFFTNFAVSETFQGWTSYDSKQDNILLLQGTDMGGNRMAEGVRGSYCDFMDNHPPSDPEFNVFEAFERMKRIRRNRTIGHDFSSLEFEKSEY